MRRQTRVPVVEPNDLEARVDELRAERIIPADELGAQAHDENHRRVAPPSQALIFDPDPVCDRLRQTSSGCARVLRHVKRNPMLPATVIDSSSPAPRLGSHAPGTAHELPLSGRLQDPADCCHK